MSRAAVTDRALRYRANQAMPDDAPELCMFCGDPKKDVEVAHIDGHEENTDPDNLGYTCRSCNVQCGNTLREYGLGRLTNQYNPAARPAKSQSEYRSAVNTMLGRARHMGLASAIAMLKKTPHSTRARFARKNPGARTLGEYMEAIDNHTRGRHDKGGKVIHETPKWQRSSFAKEIAARKKARYGSGGAPDWVTNPAARRRPNPAELAAAAFESFHGYPATGEVVIDRDWHEHEHVAECGRLLELLIVPLEEETAEGEPDRCVKLYGFAGALLTMNEGRTQLFIDGGDQSVDVVGLFGVDRDNVHEAEVLGKAVEVGYYANKTHLGDEGGKADYNHKFGEYIDEAGARAFLGKWSRPVVTYDTVNEQLYFNGGRYYIPPEGISG